MKKILKSSFRYVLNQIDSPAVILIYHRVTTLAADPQQLAVSPNNFDAQLHYLKANFSLITVEEFLDARLRRRPLPKKTVMITFDDGYADNFYKARPILESHRAQALFYITTSLLNTNQEFWWDTLERVFLRDLPTPNRLSITINNVAFAFDSRTPIQRKDTYNALHPLIKECVSHERDEIIRNIMQWANVSYEGRESHRILTFEELKIFGKSSSVVIGAHTHTHSKLSCMSYSEQYDDILESKEILEHHLGYPIDHFSYPFGTKSDYTSETKAITMALGFKMVCANDHNQVHRWHSNFELPRMLVRDWDINEFKFRLNSFFKF